MRFGDAKLYSNIATIQIFVRIFLLFFVSSITISFPLTDIFLLFFIVIVRNHRKNVYVIRLSESILLE